MRRILGAMCAVAIAVPAVAQEPAAEPRSIAEIVKSAQPTTYEAPACDLGSTHFKVSSGRTYVKSAVSSWRWNERTFGPSAITSATPCSRSSSSTSSANQLSWRSSNAWRSPRGSAASVAASRSSSR